ncbi:MAG: hypothetical protein JO316_08985 [Abitibacteriaceae bacterium]|nr:hypothetical protein [Abditibacteriaceae bacterium]
MQILKMGRTCLAVALCVVPLSVILSGCKGDFKPNGGPKLPTPIPGRTPTGTPGVTPGSTPSGTPGVVVNATLVGNYTGTFSLPAFQEVNRVLTLQVNSNGTVTGSVPLSLGGTLPLTGTISPSGDTLTLTGNAADATSGSPITITLTGRLNVSQGNFASGAGTVQDQFNDTGTWLARKNTG